MRNPQRDRGLAHQYADRMVEHLKAAEECLADDPYDSAKATDYALISSCYAEAIKALHLLHNGH